jgi:hypothetical protein
LVVDFWPSQSRREGAITEKRANERAARADEDVELPVENSQHEDMAAGR